MKTNILIFFLLFLISTRLFSQASIISLEECQQKARENYPLIKQYDLISLTEQYTLDNLAKNYLPQISLNGQATYQSAVTKMPITMPGLNVPVMQKDEYKATIDVSQLVWDGGATRSQQQITKANTEVERQKIEVSLYAIKDRVNQLYFGVLTINEQLKQLQILTSDLQTNYKQVQALVKNGVAMVSDLDLLQVELLNTDQNKIELNALKMSYLKMLKVFINENLDESTELQIPQELIDFKSEIKRPELALYEKQTLLFNAQESSIKAKNMPKFSLFLQGGYGRPGLNMLEPEFKTFAIGGLRLSWDFGNLYTKGSEKKLIETDKSSIEVQKKVFLFNTDIQLTQMQSDIQKYRELMKKDEEIISLRSRVKTTSESKYKNGVYQMNDLISDINAENQARQAQSLHEIQYLVSIYNYNNTQGK